MHFFGASYHTPTEWACLNLLIRNLVIPALVTLWQYLIFFKMKKLFEKTFLVFCWRHLWTTTILTTNITKFPGLNLITKKKLRLFAKFLGVPKIQIFFILFHNANFLEISVELGGAVHKLCNSVTWLKLQVGK